MSIFHFKAVDPNGKVSEGDIEAPDRDAVMHELKRRGLTLVRADEKRAEATAQKTHPKQRQTRKRRLSSRAVSVLTEELSTLLEAGIELDRALLIMAEASHSDHETVLLRKLHERIQQGQTFSAALTEHPEIFSPTYINLVRAGEATGLLSEVVARLANYLNAMSTLRDRVLSALIYPAILVTVSGLSIIIVITFVLPEFAEIFAEMDAELPVLTRVVMAVAEFVRNWWWLGGGLIVVLAAFFRQRYRQPSGRHTIDAWLLRLPLAGSFIKQWETARFSRNLSVLVKHGVPLADSLSISADAIGNQAVSESVHLAAGDLRLGGEISARLLQNNVFPRQAVQMIRVGEQSGELTKMLAKIADLYDRRVAASLERGLALIEPVLILCLAAVIALIILSILLAILGINDLPV